MREGGETWQQTIKEVILEELEIRCLLLEYVFV